LEASLLSTQSESVIDTTTSAILRHLGRRGLFPLSSEGEALIRPLRRAAIGPRPSLSRDGAGDDAFLLRRCVFLSPSRGVKSSQEFPAFEAHTFFFGGDRM